MIYAGIFLWRLFSLKISYTFQRTNLRMPEDFHLVYWYMVHTFKYHEGFLFYDIFRQLVDNVLILIATYFILQNGSLSVLWLDNISY